MANSTLNFSLKSNNFTTSRNVIKKWAKLQYLGRCDVKIQCSCFVIIHILNDREMRVVQLGRRLYLDAEDDTMK